jgi:hypothetical protein
LKLPVWAINDLEKAAKAKIAVYVVKADPPYVYVGEPAELLFSKTFDVDIPADSATPQEVVVSLPKAEGSYWLYATLQAKGLGTVISKRPIHVLDRNASIGPAKGVNIAVIEQDSAVQDWAKSAGMDVKPVDGFDYQTLVIGRNALGSEFATSLMKSIEEWVGSGGRLVILDQTKWPQGRFDIELTKKRDVSYLFKEKGQEHDPIWQGIADAYMENWNGSGAEGLTHYFTKTGAAKTLAIGSSDQQGLNARALLRLPMGKGEILVCQITIAERLTQKMPMFDPVAERLMVNLIAAAHK